MNIKDFIISKYTITFNDDLVRGWEVNGEKLTSAIAKTITEAYNESKDDSDNVVSVDVVTSTIKKLCDDQNLHYSKKEAKAKDKDEQRQSVIDKRAENAAWMKNLVYDSKGGIKDDLNNVLIYLFEGDDYKKRIRYNDYSMSVELDGEPLTDAKVHRMVSDINTNLGFYAPRKVDTAVGLIPTLDNISYHPVKDYLNTLVWDGEKRIDTVLIDWFGADDNIYVREASRKWMLGAIKRIFQPGCKFDFALMLVGATGIGKSTFCQRLAKVGGFTDKIDILNPKDYVPLLQTNWIVAFDERGSLSKRDNNDIKTFLSAQEDKTRLSYGKNATIYKRHNAFIGTTNDDRFLNDYSVSEERRYWTIKCNSTDKRRIPDTFSVDIVDQLWAEAYYLYKSDTDVDLSLSEEAYELFKEDQKQFKTIEDDQSYMILEEKLNVRSWDVVDVVDSETFVNIVTNPNLHVGDKQFEIIPVSCINTYLSSQKIPFAPAKLKRVMEELGWEKTKCNVFIGEKKTLMPCFRRKDSQTKSLRLPESPTPTVRRAYEEEPLI